MRDNEERGPENWQEVKSGYITCNRARQMERKDIHLGMPRTLMLQALRIRLE